jgi:hypothetical protein
MVFRNPNLETRPYWVTPEIEHTTRKTLALSKLQAVKDLRNISPLDDIIEDPNHPGGTRLVSSFGLKELKAYVDDLEPLKDSLEEMEKLIDQVEDMRKEIEIITNFELANLLADQFPQLSPENRTRALTDWEYLKSIVKNTSTGNQYGI